MMTAHKSVLDPAVLSRPDFLLVPPNLPKGERNN